MTVESWPEVSVVRAKHADYDVANLFAQRERERFAMHARHLNEQTVRVLKAIGYDVGFCRAEAQYLYDREGTRYLDLLSGFGVFAIGRNHPALREASAGSSEFSLAIACSRSLVKAIYIRRFGQWL
jgi:4-aminobutyrate aminotransferase-like enzyme